MILNGELISRTDPKPMHESPRWMKRALMAAAIYNGVWGALVVVAPDLFFRFAGVPAPTYPAIWQCVGMIVGVYGIGYAIAASNPLRHWPIVLVGLLGKLLGPIGFVWAVFNDQFPAAFVLIIITNDLIWWIPFGLILAAAYQRNVIEEDLRRRQGRTTLDQALRCYRAVGFDESLAELSRRQPLLVVFLRHAGCTFCREMLDALHRERAAIEKMGLRLVIVHMSSPAGGAAHLAEHGLAEVAHVSDPERNLYAAFQLRRGFLGELFGPWNWWRGLAATIRGHFPGRLEGDGFQMPGVFVVENEAITTGRQLRFAGEWLDLGRLGCLGRCDLTDDAERLADADRLGKMSVPVAAVESTSGRATGV